MTEKHAMAAKSTCLMRRERDDGTFSDELVDRYTAERLCSIRIVLSTVPLLISTALGWA